MKVPWLTVAPRVRDALAEGRPVVALESTLISHGLPYPQNLEVARASEAAVLTTGAVPATVAIHEGRMIVGLDDGGLQDLASEPSNKVVKAARPNLASAFNYRGWAATTVSATMIGAHAAGIEVFATGGIGGVHRGALAGPTGGQATFDISADLEELARTPTTVVCAGPKAILDIPATLEYLETRGVPVVTIGQPELPGFYSRTSSVLSPSTAGSVLGVAGLVRTQRDLGLAGVLVCVPVPEADALPGTLAREAVERAVREAEDRAIGGPALTPWLLGRIAELTDGASVRANTALIVNNARVAGELAGILAG